MKTPWRPRVDLINNGEPVDAPTADRPLQQLADQTKSLHDQVSDLNPSSGRLIFSGAALDDTVAALDFVYFDSSSDTFKPAIAEVVQNETGEFVAGPRSYVVGFVIAKSTATQGDVLQIGRINLDTEGIDPNSMVEDPILVPFQPGRFFLSSKVAGKMTSSIHMPNVQVGFFTTTECHIQPLQKDIFEAHYHYRFGLTARPAASQNFSGTGWTSLGASGPGAKKYVDYYNELEAPTEPPFVMCIRPNGQAPIPEDQPVRVEFGNESGQLRVKLFSDNLDYYDVTSGSTEVDQPLRDWPAYGEWISIDDTNLEVSFYRPDGTYSDTLAADAASFMGGTPRAMRVYMPTDMVGWANANPFDSLVTPVGALYRYLTESDTALSSAFPPLPLESAVIELNGVNMVSGEDFKITQAGIWYLTGDLVGDFSPWPSDYNINSAGAPENGRNMNIQFIKATVANDRSLVFSIKGIAPIKVSDCPTGNPASTGNLQISIDLGLMVDPKDPITQDVALVSVDGVTFVRGDIVSEIIEGAGIKVDRLSTTRDKNVGKLRISRSDLKFEGEFTNISLRNAKETATSPVLTYIDFLPASQAACGITAGFKLPTADLDPTTLKLKIFGTFRGDTAVLVGTVEQTAIFKVTYHVLRPGFSTAAMNDSTAVVTQYWKITFPPAYAAGKLLTPEYPYDATDANAFQIDTTTLADNPGSLVAISGGFHAGDPFSITIDRVAADLTGNVDTYPGRVGLLNMRWILP